SRAHLARAIRPRRDRRNRIPRAPCRSSATRMNSARAQSSRVWIAVGVLATLILAGLSLVAVGAVGGGFTADGPGACAVPHRLPGTTANITLTNMGGPMRAETTNQCLVVPCGYKPNRQP